MKRLCAAFVQVLCLSFPGYLMAQMGPGVITTFAGSGTSGVGFAGDGGPAVRARLDNPPGVTVDVRGNIYIADIGSPRIRRVGPDSLITTLAGTGVYGFSGDGGSAVQA